ncbi:hypothetical protein Dimus_034400 [Dionaea muscipula]
MASQAARLCLRMQKEIKLLLADPPLGAAFPLLSSKPADSLSIIDAELPGPEGTVYAGGIFQIKVQIPDRYPLQPPIVTFVTPIYHPNIDNGGRICLDILNLPPKGAWQPSLNLSTVLISIGLLLVEPNPDDGLMCEASKEYKYNRQVFDHKARSMTEKYAKPRSGGSSSTSGDIIPPAVNLMHGKGVGEKAKYGDSISTYSLGHDKEKPFSTCSMLSQESSRSVNETNGKERVTETREMMDDVGGSDKTIEVKLGNIVDQNPRLSKLSVSKRRLSLSCYNQLPKKEHTNFLPDSSLVVDSDDKLAEKANNDHCKRKMNMAAQKLSFHSDPSAPDITPQSAHAIQLQFDINLIEKERVLITDVKQTRFSASRKLSLGFSVPSQRHGEDDDKENVESVNSPNFQLSKTPEPSSKLSSKPAVSARLNNGARNCESNSNVEKYRVDKRLRKELTEQLHCSNDDKCPRPPSLVSRQSKCDEVSHNMLHSAEPTAPEVFIVLDSEEDSDDEKKSDHKKFNLSLTKKQRLVGKLSGKRVCFP